MAKIRIVTDSTADLNPEIYKDHHIHVVPLKLMIDDRIYRDGFDLKPDDFYNFLEEQPLMPTTSQPSPGDFLKVYQQLKDEGVDTVISIHLSSKISGTYNVALLAKEMISGIDITVIDSLSVCGGLGLISLAAAKAIESGANKEEIISLTNKLIKEIKIYFLVDTLEYLHRGGRINKAQFIVGSLLNIKPLITVKDGVLQPFMKVRGKNKGIQKIIELVKEDCENQKIVCYLVHAHDKMALEQIENEVNTSLIVKEKLLSQIGTVIGAHTGPGAVGIAFYNQKEVNNKL